MILRALSNLTAFLASTKTPKRLFARLQHFTIRSLADIRLCEKYNVVSMPRPFELTTKSPHAALGGVAPHRITEFFACNKSDTTGRAVSLIVSRGLLWRVLTYDKGNEWCLNSFSLSEEFGDISAGFNSFQPGFS